MTSQYQKAPHFYGDYSFNTGKLKQFSVVDYVFFSAILVISAVIGFYFAWKDRHKKSMDHFLLAGKNMSPIPVAMSLLASFMSAITLLGTPAEQYNFTTMYWWIGVGYILVILGSNFLYIPVFYNLEITSAYEYLEKRFSRGVRVMASSTFVLQMTLYMAIVLYAPSLALNAVTGFTLWGSVISVGLICTLYTAVGGMKAVLWTDSFQIIMMVASQVAIVTKGAIVVGGLGPAWESGYRNNRIWFTDFRLNPTVRHTVWSLTIGAYFTWIAIFGTNQAQVQRALTCPTLKKAQIAMWINIPGLFIILYLSCFTGIFMAAFYEKCDPLKANFVNDSNQILPMFVMDILADVVGLPGLWVAGLFSGALSTLSSGLNSVSAVIYEDIVKNYCKPLAGENQARLVTQFLAVIFGLICLAMTVVASKLGNILQGALALFGVVGGPLLGVFSLGMFFPFANAWGAYSGLLSSLVLMFWIATGAYITKPPRVKALTSIEYCNLSAFSNATLEKIMAPITKKEIHRDAIYPLYTVSYLWYSAIAVTSCIVIGLIVSYLTGLTEPKDVDPRVICPLFDILFPFLPESIRKPLRFGIIHEGKYDKKDSIMAEQETTDEHLTEDKEATNDQENYAKAEEVAAKKRTSSVHGVHSTHL